MSIQVRWTVEADLEDGDPVRVQGASSHRSEGWILSGGNTNAMTAPGNLQNRRDWARRCGFGRRVDRSPTARAFRQPRHVQSGGNGCREADPGAENRTLGILRHRWAMKEIGVLMLEECSTVYARRRFGEVHRTLCPTGIPRARCGGALMDRAVALATARGWSRLEVGAPPQPQWARHLGVL